MNSTPTVAAEEAEPRKLRHVVMFQFKETATPEQVKTVVDAFAALPSKIDSITGFEHGTNNSPENLNDGFTHCFTVTFASEEGRAAYLPHPEHKAFVEVLKPHLEKVLVFDYWAK
ncbi:Dabb family protein [Roseimaritima ulvae]|uniref:Stress responsive A/B Barrel Domain protein n=1 Tax=Roseimaritima ulvae TaxID=980254 RepID=A0A5B9QUD6_9BACT|nr:Dabb family protein [Roseimaritima ulvae]QEG41569.1 Stress responsive A/B Barrel Domain protein [Roseimaritima ulvae]